MHTNNTSSLDSTSTDLLVLHCALELANKQIAVFPCGADKKPLTEHGFKNASTDLRQVRRMFGPLHSGLIGVPTGDRFDVIDLDLEHDEAQAWYAEHGKDLPQTRRHRTRSGGWHLLVKPDRRMHCSQSKIAPHIDTRGRGGYIIWWPALGFDVENEYALAATPEWFFAALGQATEPTVKRELPQRCTRPDDPFMYHRVYRFQQDLERLLRRAATAPRGCRQSTYWWVSMRLKEFVDEGLLEQRAAYDLLYDACKQSADPGTDGIIRQAIRVLR